MHKLYHSLENVELSGDAQYTKLSLGPEGLEHGSFSNSLQYYVLKCAKPSKRVAIALAVRIGSVYEEEYEQGVAHIIEHLAFNATEQYDNHALIAFLEGIGAQFGACQNAHTSADETVYQLVVPTDNWDHVEQAFSVLAQWAFHIRCAQQDIDKERGAVLEEWRMSRDARGRAQEAHWKLIMQGSRYEDRLPIGTEAVIKGVGSEVVKAFFQRWYRPENMAVVVVGDFPDAGAVVESLRKCLDTDISAARGPATPPPIYSYVPHTVPRYQAFSDKEAQDASVFVSFKHPRTPTSTPAEYLEVLKDQMFETVLGRRLSQIARQPDPPFMSASAQDDPVCATTVSYILYAACYEGQVLVALETLLREVARIRLHGVGERELRAARSDMEAEVESVYVERDQSYCWELRDEYVRHFLNDEFVTGRDYEARLAKTLLPEISAEDVRQRGDMFHPSRSCVVKTVEHRSRHTAEELAGVVARVMEAEERGEILPWTQNDVPDSLLASEPVPGEVVGVRHFEELQAVEWQLSNGMRVALKSTNFLDDEVLLSGAAVGGLSEVPPEAFHTLMCGSSLAAHIGAYGLKPHILEEVLAGRRASCSFGVRAFQRYISGEASPSDMESLLQLLHLLFTNTVEVDQEDISTALRAFRQGVAAQTRDPSFQYSCRIQEVNYGGCYFFKPLTLQHLKALDVPSALSYHNTSFSNPQEFTFVIVGNITPEELQPLVCRYLASIPPRPDAPPPMPIAAVSPLPCSFPLHPVEEEVAAPMVSPLTQAQISFPVQLPRGTAREENVWLINCCRLLETRLLQKMRFEFGDVYTVSAGPYFGTCAPSEQETLQGDVAIVFTCDPANRKRLQELALDELQRLQTEGPTAEDVATVINLEHRAFENNQQENPYWLEHLERGYQSWTYHHQAGGDLGRVYALYIEARAKVLAESTPAAITAAFRRLFPHPCRSRYTAFTLVPQAPLLQRLQQALASLATTPSGQLGLVAAAGAALGLLAFAGLRLLRSSSSSSG